MRDYDFHPGEDTVRSFGVPRLGLIANDDRRCVYQSWDGEVVLRHYAFVDEWFKLNLTFDQAGQLVETGTPSDLYAANCDISTPMIRVGDDISAVDLFLDVLVRADGRSYAVADLDQFVQACSAGLVSAAEARAAESGLERIIGWIDSGRLWSLVSEVAPAIAADAPPPLPFLRTPISEVPSVMAGSRPTW